MKCKIIEMELFEPTCGIRKMNCGKCGERINHYAKAEKLDKPEVFGSATDSPETFTHRCVVSCKNGCTKIVLLGVMEKSRGFGCGS